MITEKLLLALLTTTKQCLPQGSPSQIDATVLKVWSAMLEGYDYRNIADAFRQIYSINDRYPTIAEVLRILEGSDLSVKEAGQDTASKIETAIGKFGGYNSQDAEKWLGSVAWATVQQCGGWARICDTTNDQLLSAKKMWREVGETIFKRSSQPNRPTAINQSSKAPEQFLKATEYIDAVGSQPKKKVRDLRAYRAGARS
jgi:hypothetical protein